VSDEELQASDPDAARLRRNGQLVTGYWKAPVDFVTVNIVGSQAEIDAFIAYFDAVDVSDIWYWGWDGKVDFETEYEGQYNDLLAIQEDRIEYDENGDPVGSVSPSFADPNWANGWLGQDQNRFARSVDRGLDGGFS
jgi:hypothetical protein